MSVHDATPQPTQDPCTIRRCTVDDAGDLAQIGAATFLESYAGWLPGKDILAHCRRHHTPAAYTGLLRHPETTAWVAEAKEAPVGYLVLTAPEFPPNLMRPRDVELKRIYLFSRYHATGLAGRLLQAAVLHATEQARTRMLVGLHRENERAFAFYRRQGFAEIGSREFQMGDRCYQDPVLARILQQEGQP